MSDRHVNDSLATNKAMASILVAGIVFMVSGLVADGLVHAPELKKTAIEIDVPKEVVAAAPVDAPLPPIAPLLAKADPAEGAKDMQKQCSICHNWDEGGPAKVGPNLWGIVGNKHAHMAGFNYSAGLAAISGPWTYDELNAWIRNPRSVVSGTRMSFAGIDNDQLRADVIDYLHTLSHDPVPLPPAATPATPATAAPTATTTPAGTTSGTAGQQTQTEKASGVAPAPGPQGGAPPGP